MSNAHLWVVANLSHYCPPGTHDYLFASDGSSPGMRWCGICYKEEALAGGACMVCDLPPVRSAHLENNDDPPLRADGKLCRLCWEAFRGGDEIAGWRRHQPPRTTSAVGGRLSHRGRGSVRRPASRRARNEATR